MSYGQENYATGYEQAPHQQPHQQQQPQQMADPTQQMQNGGNLESVLVGIGNIVLFHDFEKHVSIINSRNNSLLTGRTFFSCIAPPGHPSSIYFLVKFSASKKNEKLVYWLRESWNEAPSVEVWFHRLSPPIEVKLWLIDFWSRLSTFLPFYQDKTASLWLDRTLIFKNLFNSIVKTWFKSWQKKSLFWVIKPVKMISIDIGISCHKTL